MTTMKRKNFRPLSRLFPVVLLVAAASVYAADVTVNSKTQLATALTTVVPGDTIIWQNGTYDNLDTITFEPVNMGTSVDPITFRAETPGGVIFRGNTRLQFGGQFLVISGFRFDNSGYNFTGTSTAGFVISSRAHSDLTRHAHNSRVTDCAIINYDNPAATSSTKWIQWYGSTNRFDHNFVTGKRTRGATFITELHTNANFHAAHRVDNNVFADRPPDPAGANEFETVRTGTSEFSTQDARMTVESNFFYRCSGEAEVVSNKSAENTYRYNTFIECAGSLTLRHGRGCTVEGNVFFGGNVPNSGGIRLANQDHVVVNNYIQDVAGTSYQAALAIMNGTTWNPPANSPDLSGGYVVVKDCVIAHNTIINAADPVNFGVGNGSSGRNTEPQNNTLAANIIVSSNAPLFTLTDTPLNTTYLSNLVWGAATGLPADPNLTSADPLLTADGLGIQRPSALGPAAGGGATELLFPGDLPDMDGALRPVIGRDIGADQIGLGTRPPAPMSITEVGPMWIQSVAPPATSDPQNKTNAVGSTVTLSVTATGGLPLFYQWRRNGVNLIEGGTIAGSDERTLLIANAQLSNAGDYDVVVNNSFGSVTSAVAVVSMFVPTFPPTISTQPTNQNVVAGGNASFSVGVSGTSPFSYQWYFNTSTILVGETGSSLSLVNVQAGNAGDYSVVVTNLYGAATSAVASLTVQAANEPPAITASPTNLTITAGQTAVFTVTASGTPTLNYQWYFETTTPLIGATSSTLSIPNAQAIDAGAYSVVVTNNFGSATSAVATLTVNPAGPANSYNWDASTGTAGIQDGTGTWSVNNANWLLNGAGADLVWDNAGPNDAVFGGGTSGTAGNVSIPGGTTVTVRNITFNAPSAGSYTVNGSTPTTSILNLSGTPMISVASGVSATIKAIMSGTGFSKEGPGTLTLDGGTGAHNTYSGLLTVNGGTLILKKGSDGIEGITADGVQVNAGATLQLPKKDQINDAATVTCAGGTIQLVSSGGETFASLVLQSGVVTNSDLGTSRILVMTTSINLQSGTIDGNAVKTIRMDGAAALTKTTAGTAIIGASSDCRYTGPSTISGGTLVVNGIITASSMVVADGGTLGGTGQVKSVTVQNGGTLSPGTSIGTLTINSAPLTLAAGSHTLVEVDATTSTSDRVTGFSSAAYAGDLTVVNLSGTLTNGQSFQIFGSGGSGSFTSITPSPGAGLLWSFNAASGILSVVSAVNTTPIDLTAVVSEGNLNVSWPQDHIGWQLQVQTNTLDVGLGENWSPWPDSTTTNEVPVPIDPANPGVFLRLVYPPQP